MKDFIELISKSIYAPLYYRDLPKQPASYAWKYYASLAMLLSVLMTIITTVPLVPKINAFIRVFPDKVISYYPHDLIITVQNGEVSTNVSQPYFIDFPGSNSGQATTSPLLRFAVIDTTTPVTLEQFTSYHATLWLTRNSLVALDSSKQLHTIVLGNFSQVIDVAHIRSALSELEPYAVLVTPLVVLIVFMGMLASFVAMLGYLLVDALFVYLLGKFLKQNWSYGQAYLLSLSAVTLSLLVSSVFYLLPISGIQLPFLSTALVLLVIYFNFSSSENTPTEFDKEG